MDVAYVFRKGVKDSIALRYSLRSLRNIPHDLVYVVGDKPGWIRNIIHIPAKDSHNPKSYKSRALNTWSKIRAACESNISDDFILFNDDYFILEKINNIPYYYRGKISSFKNPNGYQQMVLRSVKGFRDPLHFGTHTPIVYNKSKFMDLSDIYKIYLGLDHKILYCNHYNVSPIEKMKDCKIRNVSKFKPKGTFLSTVNKIESSPIFEKEMGEVFPDKSKYEL